MADLLRAEGRHGGRHVSRSGTHQEPRSGRPPAALAVGIEAGFVPSDEPEPDYEEEANDEEVEERRRPRPAKRRGRRNASVFDRPEGPRESREGGRRRRRRGGRGRNRDRGERATPRAGRRRQRRQPAEAADCRTGAGSEDMPGTAANGQQDGRIMASSRHWARMAKAPPPAPPPPRPPRRTRPGSDVRKTPEGIEHHQTGFVSEADRFGAVPDEIDTTPDRRQACAGRAVGAGLVAAGRHSRHHAVRRSRHHGAGRTASPRKRAGGRGRSAASDGLLLAQARRAL